MPNLRLVTALVVTSMGCERAEPPVEPPVIAPDAPEAEAMRSTTTVNEPPPPAAAPVAPDLVGVPGRTKQWFLALTRQERHAVRQICRLRRANPCWGLAPVKRDPDGAPDEPDAMSVLLASVPDGRSERLELFCRHTVGGAGCNTPLVVAFDAQPIQFTAPAGRFAFVPGEPVASDWPSAQTPWIALDRDGDGAITSGAELFGDATPTPGGTAGNGFAALAALDDNHDGVIDRRDAAFGKLLLWADANADRRSAPAELTLLADVVVAIPLAHAVDVRCARGNCEGERGSVSWRDATGDHIGAVIDIYLASR